MPTMNRIAYLNCEIKSRDLSTRLLIASHLLNLNVPVVVGQLWALVGNARARKSIPGTYLFATSNSFQARAMKWVKEAGNFVIASDEEALPLVNSLSNVSSDAIDICDKFLVDTELHKSILIKEYGAKEKFHVTGSSRFEHISTTDIRAIPSNPYILFNTGFGVINSVWGSPETALGMMRSATPLSIQDAQSIIDSEKAALDLMILLIRWLIPNHRIVLRPHPSENAQTWRNILPEVEIVEGSASLPWIKNAQLVVHSNSTTGLEAALLRTPVINLDPMPDWGKQYIVPKINHTVKNLTAAQEALDAFLKNRTGPIAEKAKRSLDFPKNGALNSAREIFTNLKNANPLAGPFPWAKMERAQVDRDKFTATAEEVTEYMDGLKINCSIHELDDSVFLFTPL